MGRFGTPLVSFNRFNEMAKALKATGRSILYSLCSWGEDYVHTVRPVKLFNVRSLLMMLSGDLPLRTLGASPATFTIPSLVQTLFAAAETPLTLTA